MSIPITLKLTIQDKHTQEEYTSFFTDIEEYVCGFHYFYIRFIDQYSGDVDTLSIKRTHLIRVERCYPDGSCKQLRLKNPTH